MEARHLALGSLFRDVVRARHVIHRVREVQVHNRADLDSARHDLVQALEAYTTGLEQLGRPVPYALRDELRLQRSLDGVT